MRGLAKVAAFIALLAGGCVFDGGDLSGTSFRCDESEPCPPGFDCENGRCVSGGTEDGGMLPPPDGPAPDGCAPSEGRTIDLYDDFEDGVTGEAWSSFADGGTVVEETEGDLVAIPQDSAPQARFAGYRSSESYDLTGTRIFVEVTEMVNVGTAAQARFFASGSEQNRLYMIQENGTLRFGITAGGADSDLGTAPYDASAHRYWQIREAGGDVLGEVSPDGQSWSELGSGAAPGFVDGVEVELSAGTDQQVDSAGEAHFDDVNGGAPPCP